MNLYQISNNIIRFNIFNLNADSKGLAGHFTIYYNIKSDKYVIKKLGGFGSLTYFPPEKKPKLSFPTSKQKEFLQPIIDKRLRTACYYDNSKKQGKGKFIYDDMNEQEANGEYMTPLKQHFIWIYDGFCSDIEKEFDKKAINMLDIS